MRNLRKENPHANEADLKEAVNGAVQTMIAKARGQRRRADMQRVAAESEVEQMHNYISRIGCNLHKAIWSRDADLIRSYRRALHSGIARAHETTNREAGAWGWDPAAVDCMMQEVEESMATLLPEAEQDFWSWRKRPELTGKGEQSTRPRRSPTWRARHLRP